MEITRSSRSQARRCNFFTQFFSKDSEAYLTSKTVNLTPSILLILNFQFSSLSPKFFLLTGQLIPFFLCFVLHVDELLKLDDIIFCMFETKLEGVAIQTNN